MRKSIIFAVLLISGCVSAPKNDFERDWRNDPERVEIIDRQEEKDLLSYLAKYMLDSTERKQLVSRLNDEYIAKDSFSQGLTNYAGFSYFGDTTGAGLASVQMGLGALSSIFYL